MWHLLKINKILLDFFSCLMKWVIIWIKTNPRIIDSHKHVQGEDHRHSSHMRTNSTYNNTVLPYFPPTIKNKKFWNAFENDNKTVRGAPHKSKYLVYRRQQQTIKNPNEKKNCCFFCHIFLLVYFRFGYVVHLVRGRRCFWRWRFVLDFFILFYKSIKKIIIRLEFKIIFCIYDFMKQKQFCFWHISLNTTN